MLQRDLGWDGIVDSALCDADVVSAAKALGISSSDVRAELSFESAIVAIRDALEGIAARPHEAGDEPDPALVQARGALRSQVCAQLRLAIERRADRAYALNMSIDTTADLEHQAFALRAELIARLKRTCGKMGRGGSIAIVGPSGIGKTTLINHFCGAAARCDDPRLLCTVVTAGTSYGALEFVKHLLARLCQEVIAGAAANDPRAGPAEGSPKWYELRTKTRWSRIGAVLAWGGGSLILIGAFDVRSDPLLIVGTICLIVSAAISRTGSDASASDSPMRVAVARQLRRSGEQLPLIGVGVGLIAASQFGTSVNPLIVVGAIALAIASTMRGPPSVLRRLTAGRTGSRISETGFSSDLAATARAVLDQLEHSRTDATSETRTRDGRIGRRSWLGFRRTRTSSRTLTPTAWTLPDAIGRLEQFVYEDARDHDIWIGIDLQRMEPDASRTFLVDIDPVLRLKRDNCFVMVSVLGEGSVASAVRGRCDEVIPLEPLGFPDSRGILGHGGVGLSMPFAALCHVLSGGVPASLVDHARSLVDCKPDDRDGRMSEMARALVTPRLKRHADDLHTQALSYANAVSSDVLDWVRERAASRRRPCSSIASGAARWVATIRYRHGNRRSP